MNDCIPYTRFDLVKVGFDLTMPQLYYLLNFRLQQYAGSHQSIKGFRREDADLVIITAVGRRSPLYIQQCCYLQNFAGSIGFRRSSFSPQHSHRKDHRPGHRSVCRKQVINFNNNSIASCLRPTSPIMAPGTTSYICWVALSHSVEQKSCADFAPDFAPDIKLPLSKLTATDNIMLGNHVQ